MGTLAVACLSLQRLLIVLHLPLTRCLTVMYSSTVRHVGIGELACKQQSLEAALFSLPSKRLWRDFEGTSRVGTMAPSLSGNTLNLKFMQRAAAKKAAAAGAGAEGSSQAPNHQRGDRGGSRDRQQTQAASGVAQQNVSSSSGSSSYLATASSSLSSAAGQGNSSGFRGPCDEIDTLGSLSDRLLAVD